MPPDLANRWAALLRGCGVDPAEAAPHWDGLLEAYRAPGRAHHGLAHLAEVFAELDAVPLRDDAVEWAVWYHDAVLRPGRRGDERRSAALAREVLEGLRRPDLAPRVSALIEATRLHEADAGDLAARLFLDADMAILGASPERYRRYAQAVREEHRAIPGLLYARGRRAFLEAALARPSIFLTPHFTGRYERQARENLQAELEAQGARPAGQR